MSRLEDPQSSFEPDDDDAATSSSEDMSDRAPAISEASLIAHLKLTKELNEQLLSAISLLTKAPAPAGSAIADVIREQAQVIAERRLQSNSVIDIPETGCEVIVNGSPVSLSNKQWIVFQILADRLRGGDFSFVSTAEIVEAIERKFEDSSWKYPSSEDVAQTIFGLKRKFRKVTSATILEAPKKRGAGYGYRLSIPPQNIIGHLRAICRNGAARP